MHVFRRVAPYLLKHCLIYVKFFSAILIPNFESKYEVRLDLI